MRSTKSLVLAALAGLVLAACGGGSSSTTGANTSGTRGQLIYNPPYRFASVDAAAFAASLTAQGATGAALLTLAGPPVCGIDFHYLQYYTVGGAGEATSASGALMVPTGAAAICTGKRPIVLYAHGTTFQRSYNIADPTNPNNPAASELGLIAALFAAHGYIVVAPNYAGYDSSPLPYHPWLNADQQSKDMIDALTAARSALGKIPAATPLDGGKLFITGYSQGGHVAMATHRAMQAAALAGAPGMTVTASAPMSGPYALEAFGDAILFGQVNIGSTLFFPLLTTGFQHAYKNVYTATTDVYSTTYATGIDTLLPGSLSEEQLFTQGKLPQSALFDSTTPVTGNATLDAELAVPANPLFAAGFGNPFLINNSVRVAYALDVVASPDGALAASPPPAGAPLATSPMYPLRQDLKLNDLRNDLGTGHPFVPLAPTLLCGGANDPTVFFLNAQIMQAFWQPIMQALSLPPALVTVLNVDNPTPNPLDPFAPLEVGFTTTYGALVTAEGAQMAITQYHTTVAPFCTAAARGFFSQF